MRRRRIRATLAAAALAAAGIVAAAEIAPAAAPSEPEQLYEGVAALGNLDRATVVYPEADGERGKMYRDSAEIRASYLRERYGVVTEIASDATITPEQLSGHLLLLGWDNRLIGNERAPAPFRRDESGFDFLGRRGGPRDHLLWMYASPYNPDKYLAFWSRIDPELDRLLTFPFVGSDWVIYHDYFATAQGMFEHDTAWPPRRNVGAEHEETFIELPPVRSSAHYRLRASDGDAVAAADAILQAREQALATAARLLGRQPSDSFHVDLFVYHDAEQKHAMTGVADPANSLPLRRELYLPLDHALSPRAHEEIHLLAGEFFGKCYLGAMYEGLAFLLEERDRGSTLDTFAALLVERGIEPSLESIFDEERLRTLVRGGLGFAPAGLVIGWLDSIGGLDLVGRAYGLERGTALADLARLLGPGEPPTARFAEWIGEGARRGKSDLAFRSALARARQRAGVGDLFGRAEALEAALAIRPDDAEVAYQLGLTQVELGQYEAARARLEPLLDRPPAGLPTYLAPFVRYQLGRATEALGNRDAAAALYRAVLDLPDERDAHRLAREALARLEGTPAG